jgi:hypothetical protein
VMGLCGRVRCVHKRKDGVGGLCKGIRAKAG